MKCPQMNSLLATIQGSDLQLESEVTDARSPVTTESPPLPSSYLETLSYSSIWGLTVVTITLGQDFQSCESQL